MSDQQKFQKALSFALRYISYRQRSVFEIRKKLEDRCTECITKKVLQRLTEMDLVDDEKFAMAWRESRNRFKPKSAALIYRELANKGIEKRIIQETLNTVDDEETAYNAGRKFVSRKDLSNQKVLKRRLTSHLIRRGYSYHIIRKTLDVLWKENQQVLAG